MTEARYPKEGSTWFVGRGELDRDALELEGGMLHDLEEAGFFEVGGVSLVGDFPDAIEGFWYDISFEANEHPVFGWQAKIQRRTVPVPVAARNGHETPEAVTGLLMACKRRVDAERLEAGLPPLGIGSSRIAGLVAAFGPKALDHLLSEPAIKGWSQEAVAYFAREVTKLRGELPARAELAVLGANGGLTTPHIEELIRRYGTMAPDVLSKDPFILIEGTHTIEPLKGYGFGRACKVALAAGYDPCRPAFLKAATRHAALTSHEAQGHTYGPLPALRAKLAEYLVALARPAAREDDETFRNRAARSLRLAFSSPEVIGLKAWGAGESRRVELDDITKAERAIVEWVRDLESLAGEGSPSEDDSLNEEQATGFSAAMGGGLVLITGGPGRGKTHLCRAILRGLWSRRRQALLIAPTGRAAARAMELTGGRASTVHSAFYGNPEGAITDIIVDECSMLDTRLMEMVIWIYRRSGAKNVILVGDPDQLPPIAAGRPFLDLIEAGAGCCVRLTKVMRTDKLGLIGATDAIGSGRPGDLVGLTSCPSFSYRDVGGDEAFHIVGARVQELLDEGVAPDDIQVVCARNGYGDSRAPRLSTKGLNEPLRGLLNPSAILGVGFGCGEELRAGDRVMQLSNDRHVEQLNGGEAMIANGEMGTVQRSLSSQKMLVEFQGLGSASRGRMCVIDKQSNDLRLAYAATCHKFQGSQASHVIVAADSSSGNILDRSWFYTAVSRAESSCTLITPYDILSRSCAADSRVKSRRSRLGGHLRAAKTPNP